MNRVAAFDCGTNSLRLLVADVDPLTGTLIDVERRMEIVRLGAGVDRTGRISDDAMTRTLAVTRGYARLCEQLGVQRYRFVATSATRDAENREEFVDGVQGLLGTVPEVISGDEEARLSFIGATGGLGAEHESPYLVVDIGGGSTEFVMGTPPRTPGAASLDTSEGLLQTMAGGPTGMLASRSVDVGCVRLTERHLADDPPTGPQIAAATTEIDAAIDLAVSAVPLDTTGTLIGLAGSVTTVTAHALDLKYYDCARVHLAVLAVDDVLRSCRTLLGTTERQRAAMPFMHPGRIDVIGAGALVWSRVVQRVVAEAGIEQVVTSEHDILDGIALTLAARWPTW
jgi:exopolyphosphatase/guanosine-5'-triphosphate,3'-diphosphate pyrophosphatase